MDANDAVLKYLRDQYRPYSANDIVTNMHKEYGKTAIQKALDTLVQDKLVKEKAYGKQKVYVFNQSQENTGATNSDLSVIDSEIERLTVDLTKVEREIKESESTLNELKSSLTTTEAEKELSRVSSEIERLRKEIKTLKNNPETISTTERDKIIATHEKLVKEWKKRKNQCMQMILTVIENLPQNKTAFMQELGMETDEDANVLLSDMDSIQM